MGAFVAYHDGSWQPIEVLKISKGRISLQFECHACQLEEKEVIQSLRLRPRKAIPSDCQFFLKPGVDICLRSDFQDGANLNQGKLQPAWHNARIISIVRRSHKPMCTCHFLVSYYEYYDQRRKRKEKLDIEVIRVSLDSIFILQRLNTKIPGKDCSGLNCIEDCPNVEKSRLFSGTFFSESAWLLVLSILQKVDFEVRVLQQKLVYIILNSGPNNKAITFQRCNGVVKPKIEASVPIISDLVIFKNNSSEERHDNNISGSESSDCSTEFISLRRSKRLRVKPDRYVDFGSTRSNIRKDQKKFESQSYIEENSCTNMSTTTSKLVPPQPLINNDLKLLKLEDSDDDFFQNKTECVLKKKVCNRNISLRAGPGLIIDSYESIKEGNEVSKEIKHHKMSKNIHVYSCNIGNKNPVKDRNKNVLYWDDSFAETGLTNPKNNIKTYLKTRKQSKHSYTRFQLMKQASRENQLKGMIDTWIRNIRDEMKKEGLPHFVAQREANHSEYERRLRWKFMTSTTHVPVDEHLEHADLWKAMDNALLAQNSYKSSQNGKNTFASNSSNEAKGQTCLHEYELDEEHGLLCKLCCYVAIERRYVLPKFFKKPYIRIREPCDQDLDTSTNACDSEPEQSYDVHSTELGECNNVLSLIPQMAKKLHAHQKRAFHFLWRHIAGSVNPQELGQESNNLGGCVISHSPGSGKTFLMIAFIVSYLKLFPQKRPLIIAPNIVLCVWVKEFSKWKSHFPVHQIGGRQRYRNRYKSTNMNMLHVVSCLKVLYEWLRHPSVLLMSYSSFLSLTKKNLKSSRAKNIAEILQKSPGILVLDEGHNPRSTKSKLRKALMDIHTSLRILLSGTLYQNNLIEYFNTLCLARPSFVFEVVSALKPAIARKWKKKGVDFHNESQARRIFKDEIANHINSTEEEQRKHGLDVLGKITNHFIDVYTSGSTDGLPGLESYTILMKSTDMQQNILSKLQKLKRHKTNSFELELLITLGSMHAWLVSTFKASDRYFNTEELQELENHKFDLEVGSKVKFVINLVQHCLLKGEKVLVFCHYLQPIHFLVRFFQHMFKWKRGVQVLILYGDQDVKERGQVIEQFNSDPVAQVLLASTTACAEGISLTAASRVVLLDSEWNPSKTKQAIARVFRPGQVKVVYTYRLLASGTFEEDKNEKTALKERQSQMIFTGREVEDASDSQTQNIDDDVLKQLVENDMSELFQKILKHGSGCEEML